MADPEPEPESEPEPEPEPEPEESAIFSSAVFISPPAHHGDTRFWNSLVLALFFAGVIGT